MAPDLATNEAAGDYPTKHDLLITRIIIAYGCLYLAYIPYLWFAPIFPFAGIGVHYSTPLLVLLGFGIICLKRWAYWLVIIVTAGRIFALGYLIMTWASKVWGIKTVFYYGYVADGIMMFLIWTSFVFKGTVNHQMIPGSGYYGGALVSAGFPIAATIEVLIHVAMVVLWTVVLRRERQA